MGMTLRGTGPHGGQPLLHAGVALQGARSVMVLVHGRGDSASGILQLAEALPAPAMAYLAPQASGNTWYPNRFLAPIPSNEPWLSSALAGLGDVLSQVEAAGVPATRTVLLGFSQGACLALEFAVRSPRRYGALVGLSGGLIGPPGTVWPQTGSLDGTPVFLGCSDVDPHIPAWRVEESADVLREMGGDVNAVLYPGMDHTVSDEEVREVRRLIAPLGRRGGPE
jgi:phospholipase/carboxylesterase